MIRGFLLAEVSSIRAEKCMNRSGSTYLIRNQFVSDQGVVNVRTQAMGLPAESEHRAL